MGCHPSRSCSGEIIFAFDAKLRGKLDVFLYQFPCVGECADRTSYWSEEDGLVWCCDAWGGGDPQWVLDKESRGFVCHCWRDYGGWCESAIHGTAPFPPFSSQAHNVQVVSTIAAQYFSKKRGLANGIVYAGGGLGGTIISFAMDGVIQKLGPAWAFRILGLTTIATGLPAAWLIKERTPITTATFIEWRLFKNVQFSTLFLAGTIGTFPLFVPPFFLPLYSTSLGLSPSAGAGLVAGFNFSSAVGRLACGFLSDGIGPVNTLFLALLLSALSMLVLWPVSSSLGPLIAFVIVNGAANGGFFSSMPTVVGSVFGSRRVGVAMGMIVTGWAGGYLLVSLHVPSSFLSCG